MAGGGGATTAFSSKLTGIDAAGAVNTCHCSDTNGLMHFTFDIVVDSRFTFSNDTYPSSRKFSVVATGPSNRFDDITTRSHVAVVVCCGTGTCGLSTICTVRPMETYTESTHAGGW